MEKAEEKKYLKWYNKIGYGSGDMAANLTYGLLTNFVLLYLTDTVGLNAGIVGTLMMLSKLFDGITDILFGTILDKTHTKMGKARPWMLFSQLGVSACLALVFSIPSGWGAAAQYAWFFVFYTALNAVFYTANNIAYASLTALITKNGDERVQVGVVRFMFSLSTELFVAYNGVSLSKKLGWNGVAIIFAIAAIVINTISVFSVKELPNEVLMDREDIKSKTKEKLNLKIALGLLVKNKYYIIIMLIYILYYMNTGIMSVGIYFFTYVMGNANLYGTYSLATMLPMIVGLAFTPFLVKKIGMYKTNLGGYAISLIFRALFVFAGLMRNFPLMLIAICLAGIFTSPLTGDLNALIAETSEYTYRITGKRVDGTMYSCSSMGIKVGSAISSALSGCLLAVGGYVANAKVQTPSCISMMDFMFLWLPLIIGVLLTILNYFMKVEKANKDWDATHPAA